MSLLLHLIVYAVLAVIILTLLTLFTRAKTDKTSPPPLGEWPEGQSNIREPHFSPFLFVIKAGFEGRARAAASRLTRY